MVHHLAGVNRRGMDRNHFEYVFWTFLNFFVRRIMAFIWLLGGGIGTLWSVVTLFDSSASINIEGVPSSDLSVKLLGVAIPLIVTLFGWLFLRIPKYYPAKIQEWRKESLPRP